MAQPSVLRTFGCTRWFRQQHVPVVPGSCVDVASSDRTSNGVVPEELVCGSDLRWLAEGEDAAQHPIRVRVEELDGQPCVPEEGGEPSYERTDTDGRRRRRTIDEPCLEERSQSLGRGPLRRHD